MIMKIAILGSAGQLGSDIFKTFHDTNNITAVPYARYYSFSKNTRETEKRHA